VVLTADTRTTEETAVITAVTERYTRAGSTVIESSFDAVSGVHGLPGHAIVAAEVGVIECVVGENVDPADLGAGITRLAADGWAITVLIPTHRIGEAHAGLRRRPARLQPWWVEDSGRVRFGAWEVP